jgi:hypothetical protein
MALTYAHIIWQKMATVANLSPLGAINFRSASQVGLQIQHALQTPPDAGLPRSWPQKEQLSFAEELTYCALLNKTHKKEFMVV